MNITHVRNATLIVEYADKKILVDPMLAEKGTYPPFPDSIRQDMYNPLIELPMPVDNVIKDIDAVILTHLHLDHYDDVAKNLLSKNIKMFVQNEADAEVVRQDGFENVEVLQEDTVFEGIELIKTKGEHGRGDQVHDIAGLVCGVMFKHSSEKTLYIAGDTVWYEEVKKSTNNHNPEVIVVNGGDNENLTIGSLVMGKEDIYAVHKSAPNAKIISVHMEAANHWTLSREALIQFSKEKEISSNVFVPEDGESYSF